MQIVIYITLYFSIIFVIKAVAKRRELKKMLRRNN